MRILIVILFSFSLLSACSNQSLYYWNGYEDQLNDYHQNKPPSELIDKLEKIKVRSQSQEKPLPPSFLCAFRLFISESWANRKI